MVERRGRSVVSGQAAGETGVPLPETGDVKEERLKG